MRYDPVPDSSIPLIELMKSVTIYSSLILLMILMMINHQPRQVIRLLFGQFKPNHLKLALREIFDNNDDSMGTVDIQEKVKSGLDDMDVVKITVEAEHDD